MSTIPHRLANGVGNKPDADQYMNNWDWLTALAIGNLVENGGMEIWNQGTSFSNPADATELADGWLYEESGTTPAIATVSREATTIDTETYSMKVDITTGGSSDSDILIEQSLPNVQRFSGRTIVFGARVQVGAASVVRVRISDGVTTQYSSFHTGGGSWELLQAQMTVDGSPTEMKVSIAIDPADATFAVYIDSIHLYDVPSQISSTAKTSLAYVPLLTEFLNKSGGVMTGDINMNSNNLSNSSFSDAVGFSTGAEGAPSGYHSGDTDTGFWFDTNTYNVSTGGTKRFQVDGNGVFCKSGQFFAQAGSQASPSYSFDGDANTGMFSHAADGIRFSCGNTDILLMNTTTIQIAVDFDPSGAASFNSGNATDYWNEISYKDLIDRGCLPWCDELIEMPDGSMVTDLEAISLLRKHPTKLTIHGLPMLDYKSFPKKAYKKAEKNGKVLPRDANDEPFMIDPETGETKSAADGIKMTMMFGVMLGGLKQIKKSLDNFESRISTLEAK